VISKAIILAAGRGKRMGKLTQDLPKPMLPLAGKPMLEHIVERLHETSVTDILIVTGYLAETIESYFGSWPGVCFRRQDRVDGTATAALLGREFAGSDSVLFTFGDILVEPDDYRGIIARLLEHPDTQAVAGVKWSEDPWQGAAVYEQDGRVVRIVEKPQKGTSSTPWNSAGLYAFRPRLFEYLARVERSARGEFEFTSAIEMLLEAGERVAMYALKGEWRDVGRPEDIAPAQDLVD
jgi:NDP-sugar pyrophosphorylase family protein